MKRRIPVLSQFAAERDAEGQLRVLVALTVLVAFVVRLAVRISLGEQSFMTGGYTFFLDLARDIALHPTAFSTVDFDGRPPIYPCLLAIVGGADSRFLPIVVVQSLVGAGTVFCAYLIGRELFSRRVGATAALFAALYPYYIVHDTAVQETGTVTFLSALATFLLLVAARRRSKRDALLAGLVLSALVLTRLTMLPFAVLAVAWLLLWGTSARDTRARLAVIVALPLCAALTGWLAWNVRVSAHGTLSEGVASQFWMAHNPGTFSAYPDSSIDLSHRRSMAMFTPAERAEYMSASRDVGALESWFARQSWQYIRRDPALAVRGAIRMLTVGFSWRLSPRTGGAKQLLYALSYTPIMALALVGAVISRARWRQLGVIYANVIGFVVVTALFWAHTSHRVHLDVFFMILAAYAVERWRTPAKAHVPAPPV